MNAFVLNIKNCNFKVTLVKINAINRRLSLSLSLPLSLSLSLSLDVNVCAKEGGKEKMGDFIFMMVECSRTDDYAIFRNKTCSSLCEFRAKNCIRHLHTTHNAPYLAPKILHNHRFQFLLG